MGMEFRPILVNLAELRIGDAELLSRISSGATWEEAVAMLDRFVAGGVKDLPLFRLMEVVAALRWAIANNCGGDRRQQPMCISPYISKN